MGGSRPRRRVRALIAGLAVAGAWLALGCALALGQAGAVAQKPDPPVLIGPSRVTLVGGKTLEAIAVIREPGRVRVVLADDTEIVFDPVKVVSVVALADIPDTPPPAPKPAPKGPARPGKKPAAATSATAKVHAEPAGSGKTASSKKGSAEEKSAKEAAASGSAAGDAAAKAKEERERDVDELAAMLQAAIANTALEGAGTGGPDDSSGEADDAEKNAGKDATQDGAKEGEVAGEDGAGEKTRYKPRPEDYDATRPVNKAGFRFLGPKGTLPETPPQTDFPKPSAPVTNLGFGTDTWRPSTGFSSTATWGTTLAPATSFPNRLSGLDPPITGFGPSWWRPTPATWSSSTFPPIWQPRDGFAQAKDQKAPPPPLPSTTPPKE